MTDLTNYNANISGNARWNFTAFRPVYIFVLSALAAVFVLSGCASTQSGGSSSGSVLTFTEEFPEVTPNQVAILADQDVFKVGDTADITVYNVEDLTGTYVVDRAGNVVFPLIGSVKVAGLTTLDVQEVLVQKYGGQYLQNPGISVKREAKVLGSIVVDGAVEEPGVFEVFDVVSLSEAIALAAGLTEDANGKKVYVIRTIDGQRKVKSVNLSEIRKIGAKDPDIIPGDVIFVQDSPGRVAFREFLRTVPLLNTAAILATR